MFPKSMGFEDFEDALVFLFGLRLLWWFTICRGLKKFMCICSMFEVSPDPERGANFGYIILLLSCVCIL